MSHWQNNLRGGKGLTGDLAPLTKIVLDTVMPVEIQKVWIDVRQLFQGEQFQHPGSTALKL